LYYDPKGEYQLKFSRESEGKELNSVKSGTIVGEGE
jgi:hypothetical protein